MPAADLATRVARVGVSFPAFGVVVVVNAVVGRLAVATARLISHPGLRGRWGVDEMTNNFFSLADPAGSAESGTRVCPETLDQKRLASWVEPSALRNL